LCIRNSLSLPHKVPYLPCDAAQYALRCLEPAQEELSCARSRGGSSPDFKACPT
jgi:hypothetical protein